MVARTGRWNPLTAASPARLATETLRSLAAPPRPARFSAMGLRRLVSLFLVGPLLQLTVVRADIACAKHDVVDGAHAQHATHHATHGSVDAALDGVADEQPCEVPSQPPCCDALAGCGLSMSEASDRDSGQLAIAKRAVVTAPSSLRFSLLGGPEPPPPKA